MREVTALMGIEDIVTKGEAYQIEAILKAPGYKSGYAVVINCDKDYLIGVDTSFFKKIVIN